MSDPFSNSAVRKRIYTARRKAEILHKFRSSSSPDARKLLTEHGISFAEIEEWIGKYARGGISALAVKRNGKRAA